MTIIFEALPNAAYNAQLYPITSATAIAPAFAMSETVAGLYVVTVPNGTPAGRYVVIIRNGDNDTVGVLSYEWDGSKEATTSAALSAIAAVPDDEEIGAAVNIALNLRLNAILAAAELSALPLSADTVEIVEEADGRKVAVYTKGGTVTRRVQLIGADGQPNSENVARQVVLSVSP